MEETDFIETPHFFMEIKDGILYNTIKKGAELEVEHIKEGIACRFKIQKGKPMLSVTDIRNVFSITREAREYGAQDETLKKLIIASAIITSSMATKVFANFFITFNKPESPTKMFQSMEEALEWLKNFK